MKMIIAETNNGERSNVETVTPGLQSKPLQVVVGGFQIGG